MNVETILARKGADVFSTSPDAGLADIAKSMTDRRIGATVVVDQNDRLVGLLSERDFVRVLAARGEECARLTVADAMNQSVGSCKPGDSIAGVMALMTERRHRHLPVMQEDRLVGIVSLGDVVKHHVDEIENEAQAMRDYILSG